MSGPVAVAGTNRPVFVLRLRVPVRRSTQWCLSLGPCFFELPRANPALHPVPFGVLTLTLPVFVKVGIAI